MAAELTTYTGGGRMGEAIQAINWNLRDRTLTDEERNQLRDAIVQLTYVFGPRNVVREVRKVRHYQSEGRDVIPRAGQKKRDEQSAPCGTLAGYKRHINRKEPTCEECRKAKARYNQEWREGRR